MLPLYRRGSKCKATAGIAACVIALASSGVPTLVHAGDQDLIETGSGPRRRSNTLSF